MNTKVAQSITQTSSINLHPPDIVKETDTQLLTKQFLQQLQDALCWQKQTLAEAATEIQQQLKQLEQINPTATEADRKAFVTVAITPARREQFLSALQAGWKEVIKEFLDNPYLNVGIATLEAWKNAD